MRRHNLDEQFTSRFQVNTYLKWIYFTNIILINFEANNHYKLSFLASCLYKFLILQFTLLYKIFNTNLEKFKLILRTPENIIGVKTRVINTWMSVGKCYTSTLCRVNPFARIEFWKNLFSCEIMDLTHVAFLYIKTFPYTLNWSVFSFHI